MDKNERRSHFTIIDRMDDSSEPQWVEYLRGYHRGIEAQVFGVSDERTEEQLHNMLMDRSGGSSGDPYIDSYARGYRHGFEGKKPESPSLASESSRSLNIASIV